MSSASQLHFRALTPADVPSIIRVNAAHRKVMGLKKRENYDEQFIEKLALYFLGQDRYMYGAFYEGELISFISVVRWHGQPYWTFLGAKSIPFAMANYFRPQLNGMNLLISNVIKYEATLNRHVYWYVTSAKQNRGYKGYLRKFVEGLDEFYFVSRTIEKGQQPQNPLIWKLMGEKIWSEDLMLRIGVNRRKLAELSPFFDLLNIDPANIHAADNGEPLRN